jgi:NAD(P)-dependent dehydrogenase (short-subunit alcohol dehydrogenase family)
MSRLEGKVAVISGGTSGIGLAIAQRFVKEGVHVFIFGRRRDALDEAVRLIGANITAIRADASRLEDLDRVADAVRSAKGKVDVVVSNAALVEQVPLLEITPDRDDRTFALNAKAPLFLVQKMLPMMGREDRSSLCPRPCITWAWQTTRPTRPPRRRCVRTPGLGRPSSKTAASARTR